MSRYIDAEALLTTLPDALPYKASVKRVLIQAPTADVVEVVRCKDCRWCERIEDKKNRVWFCYCRRFRYSREMDLEDYCSYGERKEKS